METLLITGGGGFVGRSLAKFFAPRWAVVTTHLTSTPDAASAAPSFEMDVTDAASVFSVFERARPSVVIHAAGNKNVRFCEDHPEEAHRVNAEGTRGVARACREFGARLLYLSTDLVFGGTRGNYREDELPRPALVYGESKLEGERYALEACGETAVCRSGGIYGPGSPLLSWLAAELEAGRSVECFEDVFNTPTYVENLAEMLEAIMKGRLTGVFHTAGRERVSRHEFFRAYTETFGLDSKLLAPASAEGSRERLLLQPDSSLSVEQTSERLGVTPDSVREGFRRLQMRGGV